MGSKKGRGGEKGQKQRRGKLEPISHPVDGWQTANSTQSFSYHKMTCTICPYIIMNASPLSYKYQALCDDKEMSNTAYGKLFWQENLDDIISCIFHTPPHLSDTTPVGSLREECRLISGFEQNPFRKTSRLEVRVMTNPWGGREPRAGMSRDRANMDTVLISQLDWRSLFCTDPCPAGNSETGPAGLRKRWSEGRG